ncbi:YgaP family membrane protein [Pseudoduganella sp. OTU4001]|uniref:YgaP family membrane protein n=1 Tax=Pseudoduganella sp. OTU4001 TaxID=3043854 RepID=UPI00313E6716
MFYVKNVPTWERVLRVVAGLAVVLWAVLAVGGLWGSVLALSAAGIVLSGLFGFCPACAMVGRKLDKARK